MPIGRNMNAGPTVNKPRLPWEALWAKLLSQGPHILFALALSRRIHPSGQTNHVRLRTIQNSTEVKKLFLPAIADIIFVYSMPDHSPGNYGCTSGCPDIPLYKPDSKTSKFYSVPCGHEIRGGSICCVIPTLIPLSTTIQFKPDHFSPTVFQA